MDVVASLSILLIMLRSAPAVSSAAPAVDSTAARPSAVHRVDALVVDAGMAERVAFEDALRLRIGERPISDSLHARNPREGELFAYLEVEARGEASLRVRLVLSDARAYVRTIETPADLRARELAIVVANLIAGIEQDDLPPDERDVVLPPILELAPPVRAPVQPEPIAPAPVAARTELGLAIGAEALLGLAAPAPDGFAAAGAHARFDARLRSGALLGIAVRGLGHRRYGHGLTRIRVALEGGYAWRRRDFELSTTLGATVEPWFVTRGGTIPDVAQRRPVGVALGGVLRVAPAWRHQTRRGRSLRLAPFVELAGSALPTGDGGVARLRVQDGERVRELFRIGGLELALGLELGMWMPRR